MARDIGWNYLQSTLPNSIIINYCTNYKPNNSRRC